MSYLDQELTELGKDKLLFYQIACNRYDYYIELIRSIQQHEYLGRFDKCNDMMTLFVKFKTLIPGFITTQDLAEIDEKMRPSLYDIRKSPDTPITFKDAKPSAIEQSITLSTDKFKALIVFCSMLRKLLNTYAPFINVGIIYSESHKYQLEQINASVFLDLYRAITKLEQLPLYNPVLQLATMGGNTKAQKIETQEYYRLDNLEALIRLMPHNEILDLLSTKRNCFNKLFELDYDYQRKENTITKSKLSIQQIKESVENKDGTYNLASTSVGRWLVKEMKMKSIFWLSLHDKPNYRLYLEIPWFKEYLHNSK